MVGDLKCYKADFHDSQRKSASLLQRQKREKRWGPVRYTVYHISVNISHHGGAAGLGTDNWVDVQDRLHGV